MPASPCLRHTVATTTTAGLVSSPIKLLLHPPSSSFSCILHLPLPKTNKNQIKKRDKDRKREICRTVVEWWGDGERDIKWRKRIHQKTERPLIKHAPKSMPRRREMMEVKLIIDHH